jgi:hypothetical protein
LKKGVDHWLVYRRHTIEKEPLEAITKDIFKLRTNPSIDPVAMKYYQRIRRAFNYAEEVVKYISKHPKAFRNSCLK